ncbi:MAG: MerR family DNA-binding transcriptional regulator [Cyanomargarita calcarea GSE-NOS-MK-12-04C]|jgi:DNA-binding transcriptional MerR regulator|uniref:MerR family DNA-binding transcriptional regulator n=1 Tax=Cyanomargarita calcarea GSE-NOS-MK-12-04C TaxID=2839659 RepID=A0A951QLB9_9CYAN|nr:MerR family DNA-binding transcriptional regulator [Cyanomargarita calcarea GSE-NOS-MK-12-04C]
MLLQEKTKQIGTVASLSGVPIKTIRYYEELGLLKASGRTEGGFRLFESDVLSRLHFIKRSQSLGLSLLEIKEFLDVHDQGDLPCEHIKVKLYHVREITYD